MYLSAKCKVQEQTLEIRKYIQKLLCNKMFYFMNIVLIHAFNTCYLFAISTFHLLF